MRARKSRLNSSVVTVVEPASILFHKLHFIKTPEYVRVPVLFTGCAAYYCWDLLYISENSESDTTAIAPNGMLDRAFVSEQQWSGGVSFR